MVIASASSPRCASRNPFPSRSSPACFHINLRRSAIHLSVANLARIVRTLAPLYGADCPAIVACRVSWPDELLLCGTLADIREQVKSAGITRTALILVGPALAGGGSDSRLYAADHHHVMRPRRQPQEPKPASSR